MAAPISMMPDSGSSLHSLNVDVSLFLLPLYLSVHPNHYEIQSTSLDQAEKNAGALVLRCDSEEGRQWAGQTLHKPGVAKEMENN